MRRSKSFTIAGNLEKTERIQETASDIDTVGTFQAIWDILFSSFPVALINVSGALIETINLIFVGSRLGPEYVCAIGIAYCWINVSAYSFLLGLASTVEGLCTEALERKDPLLCRVHLNRGRMVISALTLGFILVFVWFASYWLTLLRISASLAALSQSYLRCVSPGFFFLMQFELGKQYANALKLTKALTAICILSTGLHILWCYVFIDLAGMGFVGAGVATSVTYFSNFAGITGVLWVNCDEEAEDAWEIDQVLAEWGTFIKSGLTNAAMVFIEWIGVELLTIESAYLRIPELAATVVIQSVVSLAFMVSWGVSVSATVFIETSIDERDIANAKRYAIRAMFVAIVLLLAMGVGLSVFREPIASLFANDEETKGILMRLLQCAVGAVVVFDGLQGVLGGIIRGIGNDDIVSYGNLACYYLLTQPFAIVLVFVVGMDVIGFWMSMGVGLFCNTIFFMGIVVSQDWTKVVVERIDFNTSTSREMLARSENVGSYNSPEAKKILGLMQNTFN